MEKVKRSTRKKAGSGTTIMDVYQEYLPMHGTRPSTIYKFCIENGFSEQDFYKIAGSFDALEGKIWLEYIQRTIQTLRTDANFDSFSSREKLLAFYFTLIEILNANRSFAVLLLGRQSRPEITPGYLRSFKKEFEVFASEIMDEGKAKGEVARRPYLDSRYPQLLWAHMALLLMFWKEDGSASFEQTDAFIEKSVNLAYDIIGKGVIDSTIDFAKFLYQSRSN